MTDNSILNMVGGEKHINPHYDIKEESANKGFTGIEVNGVRFSNIQEMLVYMDKQRNEIILLEKKLKHAEENCINKTCVVFKDKEDCVAQLLELEKENAELNKKLFKAEEEYDKAFKDGAEFGYNKANEWHYVKDGDLPKTGNPCLVYLVNDCVIVARLREDNVWTTDGYNAFENVIAWKEITLPKEIKENDI